MLSATITVILETLSTGHRYGTLTGAMDVIRTRWKGKHLSTFERYYIYKISSDNLHMRSMHNGSIILYLRHNRNYTLDSTYAPVKIHEHRQACKNPKIVCDIHSSTSAKVHTSMRHASKKENNILGHKHDNCTC